jgi:hypothetical protein
MSGVTAINGVHRSAWWNSGITRVKPLNARSYALDQQCTAATRTVRALVKESRKQAKLSEKARGRGRYGSNNLLVEPPRSAQYCINTALEGVAVLLITSGPTLAENTKPALD